MKVGRQKHCTNQCFLSGALQKHWCLQYFGGPRPGKKRKVPTNTHDFRTFSVATTHLCGKTMFFVGLIVFQCFLTRESLNLDGPGSDKWGCGLRLIPRIETFNGFRFQALKVCCLTSNPACFHKHLRFYVLYCLVKTYLPNPKQDMHHVLDDRRFPLLPLSSRAKVSNTFQL